MRRATILGCALAMTTSLIASTSAAALTTVGRSTQSSSDVGGVGGCTIVPGCDFIQVGGANTSYTVPFDGVLTGYTIRNGPAPPLSTDRARLSVYRGGSGQYTLVAQTPDNTLRAFATLDSLFPARLNVKAGDVLGLRVSYGQNTAWMYGSSSGDAVGQLNIAPAIGDTTSPLNITATDMQRLNVQATLERDDDQDGYGDESQDLCPGNASRSTQGCSGVTFGSTFLTPPGPVDFTSCGAPCVQFNDQIAGQPSRSPINGVVVRWRVRSFTAPQQFRLRVARDSGVGQVTMLGTSTGIGQVGNGTDPVTLVENVRLPIATGDRIGYDVPGGQIGLYPRTGIGQRAFLMSAPADGASDVLFSGSGDSDLQYNADVEADADQDGYGDETQDLCPTDAALHLAACPPPRPPPAPPALPAAATLTALKLTPSSFRLWASVKPTKVPRLSYTASAAGSVGFVLSRARAGRLGATGRCAAPTAANRRRKACVRWTRVASFTSVATVGPNAVALNRKVKRKLLKPGRYRIVATLTATTPSAPVTVKFTVKK